MVCGSWLTEVASVADSICDHPEVRAADRGRGAPPARADRLVLTLNGQPLCLRLTFSGVRCR